MRKQFWEYGPTCYKIALQKEICKRHIKDFFSNTKLAKHKSNEELPNIVKAHSSILVRDLVGVDRNLQLSKVKNIELASSKINKLVIYPGETFSFWYTVKKPTKKKGYQDGLVITRNGFSKGIGGGLCQMANMVHWLVLHSPLEVVELHHHGDALFPDSGRRVPFGTGTSIAYNAVDYRFKNSSNQPVQLLTWIQDGWLNGELRSERPFKYRYKIVEEDSHFKKEDDAYFRNSKVYKLTIDKETGKEINKELILNNHSKVMYDYSLIPQDEIRND